MERRRLFSLKTHFLKMKSGFQKNFDPWIQKIFSRVTLKKKTRLSTKKGDVSESDKIKIII
jgi:hypothetical protein